MKIVRSLNSFAAARWLVAGAAVLAWVGAATAQNLQDSFSNRLTFTNATGALEKLNPTATLEPGEPLHAGKPGGHSVWMTWVAPTNGVVEFETAASGFDTVLAVYQLATNGSTFADLREVGHADDSDTYERESEVQIGVLAGQRYEIAVDGYRGDVGQVELKWVFGATTIVPPVLTNWPADRAVLPGTTFTLAPGFTTTNGALFKWYYNGTDLNRATNATLTLTNFQAANVGHYSLRVFIGNQRYFTPSVEIQINTDNSTTTLAQPKIFDSPVTPLIGNDGGSSPRPALRGLKIQPQGGGVVSGYNGAQIFNTTFATADPSEPQHCSTVGGFSYWLFYQPPANGTVTLDTVGSSYDTVMEVYSYNTAMNSYADLITLDCANDTPGLGTASRVSFGVVKTRQYVIAVAGVNGARGIAKLNYALNTNQAPAAPTLLAAPTTITVPPGTNVTLAPLLAGAPPLHFSWVKNVTPLTTLASGIFLPGVTPNDAGNYTVTVTNDLGSVSATLPLHVIAPPNCALTNAPGGAQLLVPSAVGLNYFVESTTNVTGPWTTFSTNIPGNGSVLAFPVVNNGNIFYRVRVQ